MRRLAILLAALLAATVSLSRCSPPLSPPVDHPNLLVAVEGNVRLKRDGWSDYVPVGFGTLIHYGDLLQVDDAATILCGDLTIKTISGRDSCPCPPGPGRLEYERQHYRDMPDNIPYIQHPRNTLVLDPHPLLRWKDTGASSYTVAIMQAGTMLWTETDVVGNEMQYPADAPTLQPDIDYMLVIREGDTGLTSSVDATPGIGFQVVAPENRATIGTRRDEILALSSLDEPARDFALAVYYATWQAPKNGEETGRSLWGEAWLLLESVAQTQDSPAVHLWMGDVLIAIKLPDEAAAAYRAAVQRAETLGDLDTQASAHIALWRVTRDEGHWGQAVKLYRRLGDEDAAEALRGEQ